MSDRSRAAIDPWLPLGIEIESERSDEGERRTLTVFLAGAECPFPCVFCDLWQHTSTSPTPRGALPSQLSIATAQLEARGFEPRDTVVKLYNASNLFEERAVPEADDTLLIELAGSYRQVTVECHPRLIGERAVMWARELRRRGSRLEVAMGFETAHSEVLARLDKKATLDDLQRASARLLGAGASLRAFLLVGAPFLAASEQAAWVARSVCFAADCGASVVSLIPVRETGALSTLRRQGLFEPPTLELVEEALRESIRALAEREKRPVVLVDLWDIERVTSRGDGARTVELLEHYNRTGRLEAAR